MNQVPCCCFVGLWRDVGRDSSGISLNCWQRMEGLEGLGEQSMGAVL